jgi:hypothetical protein
LFFTIGMMAYPLTPRLVGRESPVGEAEGAYVGGDMMASTPEKSQAQSFAPSREMLTGTPGRTFSGVNV